jgi:dTMP kinase
MTDHTLNHHDTGLLITIEGTDGCGKTTLAHELVSYYTKLGYEAHYAREPGGCVFSEELRSVLLTNQVHPDTELLGMFAARFEHVYQVIQPALKAGHVVICDRFIDSSYAYQVKGAGASPQLYRQLKNALEQLIRIDLTLFLVTTHKVLLARTRDRSAILSGNFESRLQTDSTYFERVLEGYYECFIDHPNRIQCLNGNESKETVLNNAIKALASLEPTPQTTSQPTNATWFNSILNGLSDPFNALR